MAVGDSVTLGFGATPTDGGYRSRLTTLHPNITWTGRILDQLGLQCEGYNGSRADQISPLVLAAIPTLQPATVILMAGVNDVTQGEVPATVATEVVTLAANILAAYASVQHVIVCSVAGTAAAVATYNAALPGAVAAAADARIVFCPAATGLVNPTHYVDALHPNAAGFDIITANIDATITAEGIAP